MKAALDLTYEGTFFLRTSTWFPINVRGDNDVEDPAGRDRTRTVEVTSVSRGKTEGKVEWVPAEEDKQLGSFVLTTSNSPISLSL